MKKLLFYVIYFVAIIIAIRIFLAALFYVFGAVVILLALVGGLWLYATKNKQE